jgi:hypothetical protein
LHLDRRAPVTVIAVLSPHPPVLFVITPVLPLVQQIRETVELLSRLDTTSPRTAPGEAGPSTRAGT